MIRAQRSGCDGGIARSRRWPSDIIRHCFAATSSGKFLYGQLRAGASAAALLEAREYLASFECLNPDDATSLIYARVRTSLEKRGITIPDPDYASTQSFFRNNSDLIRLIALMITMYRDESAFFVATSKSPPVHASETSPTRARKSVFLS